MTQLFDNIMAMRQGWKLTVSEKSQAAIDACNRLESAFNDAIEALLDFCPDNQSSNTEADIINGYWYQMQDAMEKRIVSRILIDSQEGGEA